MMTCTWYRSEFRSTSALSVLMVSESFAEELSVGGRKLDTLKRKATGLGGVDLSFGSWSCGVLAHRRNDVSHRESGKSLLC